MTAKVKTASFQIIQNVLCVKYTPRGYFHTVFFLPPFFTSIFYFYTGLDHGNLALINNQYADYKLLLVIFVIILQIISCYFVL